MRAISQIWTKVGTDKGMENAKSHLWFNWNHRYRNELMALIYA